MKTLSNVLLTCVLVVIGVVVYDQVRQAEVQGDSSTGEDGSRSLTPARLGRDALERLEGRFAAVERRLDKLALEIAKIREDRPRREADPDGYAGDPLYVLPDGSPSADVDDATLRRLEVHLAELQRRRRAEREREIVVRNLERLELSLDADQNERVIQEILAYRQRTRTFWKDMQERGITDRKEQLVEGAKLQEEIVATLRSLIGDEELDRAVDGLIGKGSLGNPPMTRTPADPDGGR